MKKTRLIAGLLLFALENIKLSYFSGAPYRSIYDILDLLRK